MFWGDGVGGQFVFAEGESEAAGALDVYPDQEGEGEEREGDEACPTEEGVFGECVWELGAVEQFVEGVEDAGDFEGGMSGGEACVVEERLPGEEEQSGDEAADQGGHDMRESDESADEHDEDEQEEHSSEEEDGDESEEIDESGEILDGEEDFWGGFVAGDEEDCGLGGWLCGGGWDVGFESDDVGADHEEECDLEGEHDEEQQGEGAFDSSGDEHGVGVVGGRGDR